MHAGPVQAHSQLSNHECIGMQHGNEPGKQATTVGQVLIARIY